MTDGESKRFPVSVGLSLAVHAAFAALIAMAPSVLPPPTHDVPGTEIVFEVAPIEAMEPPDLAIPEPERVPEPEPETPEPEPEPEPVAPEPEPVVPPPRVVPRTTETPPSVVEPVGPAIESGTPEGGGSAGSTTGPAVSEPGGSTSERPETPAERAERLRVLLDPTGVAGRSFVVEGPGPSGRRGPQSAAESAGSLRPRSEAEVERDLAASLRAEAMTKTHVTRERFQIRRRPDGTHVYTGHAFTATIQRDGSVTFTDRPGLETNGISTENMRFDLGDMMHRSAGSDPYAHERNRFMEETEELRARLESEAQRERMTAGLRRLRGQLARIWQDESRSPEQRRRLIFEQWAEVDDSGGDGGARGIIESFVRENLPAGSPNAYPPDELRRLNAGRPAGERFEPYRS